MSKNIRKVIVKKIRILMEDLKKKKEEGHYIRSDWIKENFRIIVMKNVDQGEYNHRLTLINTETQKALVSGFLRKEKDPRQTKKDLIDKMVKIMENLED